MTDPRIIGITSPPQAIRLGSAQKQIAVLQRTGGGGGGGGSGTVIDATTIDKGKLRLGNYLGGTANDPTVNRVTDITGEQLKAFHGLAGGPSGAQWQLSQGTIASPYAIQLPSLVVQRTQAIPSPSSTTPYGGSADAQWHTAIAGISRGNATDNTMITGLVGAGHQYSTTGTGGVDACGVWSIGAHHGIGGGFGGYFEGRIADDATSGIPGVGARARGIEIRTSNYEAVPTDSPYVATPTNNNKMNALQMSNIVYNDAGTAAGSDGMTGGTGVLFYRPIPATGTNRYGQFDVGIACAADNIPIKSAFIRDDGSSVNSILINGTHSGGAIKIATDLGSGRAMDVRSLGGTSGTDALSNLAGVYWSNYADATVVNSPFVALRKNLGAPVAVNTASFRAYVSGHGAGLAGGGPGIYSGFLAQMGDHASVARGVITGISTGGVVTHDGACQPVVGERVAIFGTSRSQHNITWIVASVTDSTHFTLTSPDGVASTGGTVNNAPGWYAFGGTVSPTIDRNVDGTNGPFNADDVAGFVMSNQGAGRATDAFYLGPGGGSGSQWWTAFACDADCEIGFNLGEITIGADGLNTSYGYAGGIGLNMSKITCSGSSRAIVLRGGHGGVYFRPASDAGLDGSDGFFRLIEPDSSNRVLLGDSNINSVVLPNNKGLYGTNAAASNTVQIARIDASSNLQVGTLGSSTVSFIQNSSEVFVLGSSQMQLATGKRIYGGDGIVIKVAATINDAAYTVPTNGMLGVQTSDNTLRYRVGTDDWRAPVAGGGSNPFTVTGTTLSQIIAEATSTSGSGEVYAKGKDSGGTAMVAEMYAAPNHVGIGSRSNHVVFLEQNALESFRLTTSQHVQMASAKRIGIGVDPVSALHFVASTAATDGSQYGSDATPLRQYRAGADILRFDTNLSSTAGIGFNAQVANSTTVGSAWFGLLTTGVRLDLTSSASSTPAGGAIRLFAGTETTPRCSIRGDLIRWGGGTAFDSALGWSSAGKLQFHNGSGVGITVLFGDATNAGAIEAGTTNGLKIGTTTGQLIGFFNKAPVNQRAAITAPTGGVVIDAEARTAINSLRQALIDLGLTA